MQDLLDKLECLTGKDVGDFGGWDGLREYCFNHYSFNINDDIQVLMLVSQIDNLMEV